MDITSIALGGLDNASSRLDKVATNLSLPSATADTVSLSNNMVDLLQAKNDFAANIKVAKTAGELAKTTIDLIG